MAISEFTEAIRGRLADRLNTRLATGEILPTRAIPSTARTQRRRHRPARSDPRSGVSDQFEVAELADQYNVQMESYFYYTASVHVVAAPNGWLVEYIPEYDIAPVLETPSDIEDGHVVLPDRPGHGYRTDPDPVTSTKRRSSKDGAASTIRSSTGGP